jgi:CheY-like chemotaxis protein/anti-sigma regulatory factor (Ser/Thr protein kinase)
VRDITDMMQIRAQEKGLRLLIDQSSKFPRYIVGDEARLRQVLINLLGNAVKFTSQGGVTIRLGIKPDKQPLLVMEVEDSGPGIAPEDQVRVFEPFVQLGEQGVNKGTGLGLTITRQFVQLMKGHLSLESTLGKGSIFRVELPLKQAAESDIVKPGVVPKGEVSSLAPGQPEYRVLIVEDQRDNQLLLSRLLEAVGFKFKVAENGKQGVQMFQEWHPHFIWMDRRMPVMDGLEATRQIRSLPGGKDVKIVAVTASAFLEQRTELIEAGMDDFVRKPYRSSEIYESLLKHLGVQYVYEGIPEPAGKALALTPDRLSGLPQELLDEMKDALESLESARIASVLQKVATHDEALQKSLASLVENFNYPAILKALPANQHA